GKSRTLRSESLKDMGETLSDGYFCPSYLHIGPGEGRDPGKGNNEGSVDPEEQVSRQHPFHMVEGELYPEFPPSFQMQPYIIPVALQIKDLLQKDLDHLSVCPEIYESVGRRGCFSQRSIDLQDLIDGLQEPFKRNGFKQVICGIQLK